MIATVITFITSHVSVDLFVLRGINATLVQGIMAPQ